ncbi:MAG: cation transporter [Clostridia bacterium]|nr:cation transporter [Clostridia bacterium]
MVKTTIGVEGMMCAKCEAHMTNAIQENFKVKKVVCSHTDKKAVVVSKDAIDEQKMNETVTGVGYKMTSFKSEPYEKKGLFSFGK